MKPIKAVWQFVSFLCVPQMGKQRRKHEQLKCDITYLIGKERAEGNVDSISSTYISRILNVPLLDVEECMKEIGL